MNTQNPNMATLKEMGMLYRLKLAYRGFRQFIPKYKLLIIFIILLVAAFIPGFLWLQFSHKWAIVTGTVLQLFGVISIIFGVNKIHREFEHPNISQQIKIFLSDCVNVLTNSMQRTKDQRICYQWNYPGPISQIEHPTLERLNLDIRVVSKQLADFAEEWTDTVMDMTQKVKQVEGMLESVVGGGLGLQTFGAYCLIVGIVLMMLGSL